MGSRKDVRRVAVPRRHRGDDVVVVAAMKRKRYGALPECGLAGSREFANPLQALREGFYMARVLKVDRDPL